MQRVARSLNGAADGQIPPVPHAPAQNGGVPEFQTRTEGLADATYVVAVAGELDLFTAPRFRAALHGALDAGAATLIVDLSACGFMDSTGISILLEAHERLNHASKPLVVVAEHPNVLQVLRLTGVEEAFGLYPTRSAALNGNGRA